MRFCQAFYYNKLNSLSNTEGQMLTIYHMTLKLLTCEIVKILPYIPDILMHLQMQRDV